MAIIENYNIEFVKRTKEILQNEYSYFEEKGREVTFLLNCLLGLIVNVNEDNSKYNQLKKGNIKDLILYIPDKIGFLKKELQSKPITCKLVDKIELYVGHKEDLRPNDMQWFLCKIRNGIAHKHLEGISHDGKWKEVRLWNEKDGIIDFEIIFTIDELRNLAIKIADDYLNGSDKTKNEYNTL